MEALHNFIDRAHEIFDERGRIGDVTTVYWPRRSRNGRLEIAFVRDLVAALHYERKILLQALCLHAFGGRSGTFPERNFMP
jgi:hypothetical protein